MESIPIPSAEPKSPWLCWRGGEEKGGKKKNLGGRTGFLVALLLSKLLEGGEEDLLSEDIRKGTALRMPLLTFFDPRLRLGERGGGGGKKKRSFAPGQYHFLLLFPQLTSWRQLQKKRKFMKERKGNCQWSS